MFRMASIFLLAMAGSPYFASISSVVRPRIWDLISLRRDRVLSATASYIRWRYLVDLMNSSRVKRSKE